MNTITKVLLALAITLSLTAVYLASSKSNTFGSIEDSSGAYEATTTRASFDGTAITAPGTAPKLLSGGSGLLGSVVITGAGTGTIDLYDATTSGSHSDYVGTTTLLSIPPNGTAGTYTCDCSYKRGLIMVITSQVATGTITWKRP